MKANVMYLIDGVLKMDEIEGEYLNAKIHADGRGYVSVDRGRTDHLYAHVDKITVFRRAD